MPVEWLLSRICEEFGCTPSQALKEDVSTVLAIMDLRAYARAYGPVMAPDSDTESLLKAGLSQASIDRVMENVERAVAHGKRGGSS